ncbi:MAG: hypothetical protein HYR85_20595 [Planctomycetes bacterium]|nr:hypothetical protein [Planctomycetota bacterium]
MHPLIALAIALLATPQNSPTPQRTDLWRVIERIADETGFRTDLDAMVTHMDGVVKQWAIPNRSTRVVRGLREPWAVPEISDEIRAKLESPFKPRAVPGSKGPPPSVSWQGFAADVASLCDVELAVEEPEAWKRVADPAVTGPALVAALSDLAVALSESASAGFLRVGEERRKQLSAVHRQYSDIRFRTCDPKVKATPEEERVENEVFGDLFKTRLAASLGAAAIALRLAEPAFLASLPARLAGLTKPSAPSAEFEGDVLAIAGDSPATRVVVGGKGKTIYRGRAAIVIDLGGDDVYERAAVVDDGEALVSIVLDLGGNDSYSGDVGPAYACGGVAILVDVAGKDTYRGGLASLGSGAFGGFALLADYGGNDTYESHGFDEGFGFGGVGLLYDRSGDDHYDGWGYAQGSTEAWGLGALIDGEGNDTYLADGHFADSYGDSGPNVFHGASQGSTLGVREMNAAGGIAALIDMAGRDEYRAGNFSQGGGYFFGFGLLADDGGDDKYFGTRYSEGYGVHQAIGILHDKSGNDIYTTRTVANLGSAWDEGVGWFLDDTGNDVYEAGGLSLGGAANTAFAIFVDGGGKDRYTSPDGRDTQGGTSDSSYHKMQSLGVLIDLGGQADTYSRADRKDGGLTWQRWFGVFLDATETSFDRLLKRPPGKFNAAEVPGRDT